MAGDGDRNEGRSMDDGLWGVLGMDLEELRLNNSINYFYCVSNTGYSLRTNQPSGLETGGVRLELSKALDLWARNSKLTFQEVNSDRADILVYFHRVRERDGLVVMVINQCLNHPLYLGYIPSCWIMKEKKGIRGGGGEGGRSGEGDIGGGSGRIRLSKEKGLGEGK
ncbi:hypothetical protein HZH66_015078 [Vespula vulgaris]|uniref:Peptidase M10 metallopeptidase domain-containing protein n=1 Tax=Vespula vulgaris TaxID=7454 RepID=A0A834MP79_VESVU|nr:hypothetical protein HZH66_015078 [Vespula vulgaris]